MNKCIWVYSKLNGANELLFTIDNNADIHDFEQIFNRKEYKRHKQFAYVLVDGIEIKLYTGRVV